MFQSAKDNKSLINSLIILSFILLSFLSVSLLLKNHVLYIGADTQFHFKRVMEIRESIIHGKNLLPSFSFNEFYGSGVMTLYPYLNLLPVVLLSFIIKSKITLVYAFFIFNTLLTLIISFYSSKSYIKFYSTSYIFSIIYSLSNVFLLYNIITSDFGIVSSYTFLPLIIFGSLKLIQGKNNWIELSIGMSLLLYSHILNIIIVGAFLLLFLIVNIRSVNKGIIKKIFKSLLLFLLITAIVWVPFLHLYFSNLNNINMPASFQLANISIKDFISGLYGSKSSNTIGSFPIISLFISIFFYKNFNYYIKRIYLLSLMIVLSVLFLPLKFITSYGIFQILNQIQQTARVLIIPQMTLSFIFALIITKYIKFSKSKILIYVLTIFIAIIMQMFMGQYVTINKFSQNPSFSVYIQKDNGFLNTSKLLYSQIKTSSEFNALLNNYGYANDDYIPKDAINMSKYVNRNIGFYNDYHTIKVNHSEYNNFTFKGEHNMDKLFLPIYAYNKERINIYLNNQPLKYYTDNNGLLMVDNIRKHIKHNNNIYIEPILDIFKLIGLILSIIGWLFILGKFIKRKLNI